MKDIGITEFPTTMATVVSKMPANSMIVIDTRRINGVDASTSTETISDWGNTANGNAIIMKGYSNARVSMIINYGTGSATATQLHFGNYATSTNKVNWNKVMSPSDVLTYVYPVGSIYMSVSYNSPASIFGGTWARLMDRFLLGAGQTYQDGQTGGAATVGLTVAQMPSHSHTIPGAGNVYFASGGDSMWITRPTTSTGYNTTTSAMGGGEAHNNMPPYLVVFMWKRTA